MKTLIRLGAPLLFVGLILAASRGARRDRAARRRRQRWVCPPCAAPCDTLSFAAAGTCPQCGMALVEAGSAAAKPVVDTDQKKVAVLLFNGAEIIDFSGPYEMFGAAGCDVYTVAATKDPITTAMGLTIVPKYAFADAPQPDVLVIPGGGVKAAANDAATLDYIKRTTASDTHTMSVCNGAFILANTGLLDGLSATTTNGNIPRLASQFPKIKVVRDQRYVDNGKLVTAAGLSAGIDGALHVIERMFGTGTAQQVALGEEYDWKPGAGYARAALADHELPQIDLDAIGKWNVVRTEGDTQHWDIAAKGHSDLAAAEVIHHVEQALEASKWTRVSSPASSGEAGASEWRFTGSDGQPWKGSFTIASAGSGGHEYTAAVAVARAGR